MIFLFVFVWVLSGRNFFIVIFQLKTREEYLLGELIWIKCPAYRIALQDFKSYKWKKAETGVKITIKF